MNEEFWQQFPPIPGFDCVKMKRDIQARIYEATKDLTAEERAAYRHRRAEAFRRRKPSVAQKKEPLVLKEKSPNYGSK